MAGRHGKGAAFTAKIAHGAITGQGVGLQGQSYAIPTKDASLKTLSLRAVKSHIADFLKFAEKHPELTFNVTAIGTGLAGYKHDDIGPLFTNAPPNCILPIKWKQYMVEPEEHKYWIS